MIETPCPMDKDGQHERRPWVYSERSGFSCRKCSKTWEWNGKLLNPTYPQDVPKFETIAGLANYVAQIPSKTEDEKYDLLASSSILNRVFEVNSHLRR